MSKVQVSGASSRNLLVQFISLVRDLRVHGIGCEVDLTRPRDCAIVYEDPLEELLIAKRRESAGQLLRSQAHTPCCAVLESNKQAVVRFWFYFSYVPIHFAQVLRSCERLNFPRRGIRPAKPPRFQQFVSMYFRSLLDQAQSPTRQFAMDHLRRADIDCSFELTVASVKVWRRMIITAR
jgi:hypothetical protein